MSTLAEILLVPNNRSKVIADCVRVIDEEVASKGGLSGLAVKGAYALVKAVKPGFVNEAVDHMLDDFVSRLDPFYAKAQAAGQPVEPYMNARPGDVAEALLAITDERAQRAKNPNLKAAYGKLRPTGKKHVEAAVPRVGRLITKYVATAPKA